MKYFLLAWIILLNCSLGFAQIDSQSTIVPENVSELIELSRWQGSEEGVNLLAFNPNSYEIVTINGDAGIGRGSIVFVDLNTNEIIRELPEASAFTFSDDGELFASINLNGAISLYETTDFNLVETLYLETEYEPVINMAISPNNQYIAVGLGGAELVTKAQFIFTLLDLETGEVVFSLDRETESITETYTTGMAFSDNSELLFLATSDGYIQRWDISTHEHQIIGEEAAFWSRILVGLFDANLAYLTVEGFNVLELNTELEENNFSVSVSDNPAILTAAIAAHSSQPLLAISFIDLDTRETFLQIWNIEAHELAFETIVGESGDLRVLDIAFSPDGTLLATSGSDGLVRIWGIPNEE
jgi:WD40 repeat protein